MVSEIFPTKIRGTAMSFSIVILWLGVVLVTQFFPVLLDLFGGAYTFWIFMINALILIKNISNFYIILQILQSLIQLNYGCHTHTRWSK